jgi:histone H4
VWDRTIHALSPFLFVFEVTFFSYCSLHLSRKLSFKMAKGKSAAGAESGKRVKKVVSANSAAVSQGSIRRLARRAGVKRISTPVYADIRSVLHTFVETTVKHATALTEYRKAKTVAAADIISALRKQGKSLYGYA